MQARGVGAAYSLLATSVNRETVSMPTRSECKPAI